MLIDEQTRSMESDTTTQSLSGVAHNPEAVEIDGPPPGVQRWLIACDESAIDGQQYYGFGALWMGWQRRGDLQNLFAKVRAESRFTEELKWNRVSKRNLPLYRSLVSAFFRAPYLSFQCIVIRKAAIDKKLHGGDYDLARRKFFGQFLVDRISTCFDRHGRREQEYHVWVDPIASSYKRADEATEVIGGNMLRRKMGTLAPPLVVRTKDSKETPAIQLCDILLGAVLAARNGTASAQHKLDLQMCIAEFLGWPSLHFDTWPAERKFNIWHWTPTPKDRFSRVVATRDVVLRHPLPPIRLYNDGQRGRSRER